jgi:hypothetical protein
MEGFLFCRLILGLDLLMAFSRLNSEIASVAVRPQKQSCALHGRGSGSQFVPLLVMFIFHLTKVGLPAFSMAKLFSLL